jgi:hypothetical protein
MIPDSLAREFPLDGIVLSTAVGSWTIRLREVQCSAGDSVRVATIDLDGDPPYRVHLHVPGETLVVTHAEGDVGWLVKGLKL